jgi:hypothetical protein
MLIDHNGGRIQRSYQLGGGIELLGEVCGLKSKRKRVCASDRLV